MVSKPASPPDLQPLQTRLDNNLARLKAALEGLRLPLERQNGTTPLSRRSNELAPPGLAETFAEITRQIAALLESQANTLARVAAALPTPVAEKDSDEAHLRSGLALPEDLVVVRVSTPSVSVGTNYDWDAQVNDVWDRPQTFSHLSIVQVNIAAPGLAAADSVTLRLYTRGDRRIPQDLMADITGTSDLSGTWFGSITTRRSEYDDSTDQDQVWGRLTNASGNSAPSNFEVTIYARRFPREEPTK